MLFSSMISESRWTVSSAVAFSSAAEPPAAARSRSSWARSVRVRGSVAHDGLRETLDHQPDRVLKIADRARHDSMVVAHVGDDVTAETRPVAAETDGVS